MIYHRFKWGVLFLSQALGTLGHAGEFTSMPGRAWDQLNAEQQERIRRGEAVFFTREIPGKSWPRAWFFQQLDTPPEMAVAIFSDFTLHKNYLPDVKDSKITRRPAPARAWVDYTLRLPFPLPNETYTVENHLSFVPTLGRYHVEWTMVRADSTREIDGGILFEPLGAGSLMVYQNLVVPGSAIAGLAQGRAMESMRTTAISIRRRIEALRREQSPLLQEGLQALRNSLPGSP